MNQLFISICTVAIWQCVCTFPADITYLQGLSYGIGEAAYFTCNFAFGPDFSTLSCAITIDNERPVHAVVNNGTPPSATYATRDLAGGSHTVTAQAVRRSDLSPVESGSRFLEFTVPDDDADGEAIACVLCLHMRHMCVSKSIRI